MFKNADEIWNKQVFTSWLLQEYPVQKDQKNNSNEDAKIIELQTKFSDAQRYYLNTLKLYAVCCNLLTSLLHKFSSGEFFQFALLIILFPSYKRVL